MNVKNNKYINLRKKKNFLKNSNDDNEITNIRQYDNNSLNYTSLWKLKQLVENKSQFKAM